MDTKKTANQNASNTTLEATQSHIQEPTATRSNKSEHTKQHKSKHTKATTTKLRRRSVFTHRFSSNELMKRTSPQTGTLQERSGLSALKKCLLDAVAPHGGSQL
jgi:hypothetical protein